MDLQTQRILLRRLFELREGRTTAMSAAVRHQPAADYTDPRHLARELQVFFREHPLVVGLSADLRECGEYRAIEVAGVPVLLVRGEDGVVLAFLNSCRHRGSRVAEGAGSAARVFKCPYHAWCYDIGGRLLGQPLAQDAFAGESGADLGLVPLPVAEAGGLIMLAPSADAPEFDGTRHLAGLAPELAGFDFADDFTLFAEQHHTVRANWKQPYETFLEAYHVFALHGTTLAKQIMSTPMLADFFGPHGRGLLMGRDTDKLLQLEESQWSIRESRANLVYWLFPNAILGLPMTGHAELWMVYPDPREPGVCHVHLKFYVPSSSVESRAPFWQRMLDYTSKIVLEEDFKQQAAIHQALSSGSHPGLVFGRNEPALIHYHHGIDAALSAAVTAAADTRGAVAGDRNGTSSRSDFTAATAS